jgi:hypothetical protein
MLVIVAVVVDDEQMGTAKTTRQVLTLAISIVRCWFESRSERRSHSWVTNPSVTSSLTDSKLMRGRAELRLRLLCEFTSSHTPYLHEYAMVHDLFIVYERKSNSNRQPPMLDGWHEVGYALTRLKRSLDIASTASTCMNEHRC